MPSKLGPLLTLVLRGRPPTASLRNILGSTSGTTLNPAEKTFAALGQLESMICHTEVNDARMRLSVCMKLCNVQEAYHLMRDTIRTMLNPTTDKIDMGLLKTGKSQQRRRLREDMRKRRPSTFSAPLRLLRHAGSAGQT
ncbi:hypothetical protein V8E53_000414 [Lactarius tabidus]